MYKTHRRSEAFYFYNNTTFLFMKNDKDNASIAMSK